MHPMGLSCGEIFVTHLAYNSRVLHMFCLHMVCHVARLLTKMSTLFTLEPVATLVVQLPDNSIQFIKT